MEYSLHPRQVTVITTGGLTNKLSQLLFIVRAVGVGRRILARQQRIADNRVLLRLNDGGEDAVEGVIIRRWNRVEFVIVAA